MKSTLLLAVLLGGCATQAAPVTASRSLRGPDAAVMVTSERLPAPKEGEDAKALLTQCRAAHGEALDKLAPLQSFAKRVTQSKQ